VWGLVRFGIRLRGFLRNPITVEQAEATIRLRLRARDQAFLDMVERAVFGHDRSPYLRLLRAAGCELGDVRQLTAREGVEGALEVLRRAGVYVTFDEFKGRIPATRGSQRFAFRESDFDHPLARADFPTTTGGSRGRPSRILLDLDHLADQGPHWAVWFAEHGWLARPLVFVTPTYPGIVARQLRGLAFGKPFVRWFSTGSPGSWSYRLVSAYLNGLMRWQAGLPAPEPVSLVDAGRIAAALAAMRVEGPPPCVVSSPSTATRIALAGGKAGPALAGVAFLLGGEPVTAARRRTIEAAGATAVATYGFSEAGGVGLQCSRPSEVDEVHVLTDRFAVIAEPRSLAGRAHDDVLLTTALGPASPKVLLNTEIGDTGTLVSGPCECRLGRLGYDQRLHTVRSFQKLTGEGVTFRVADVQHLLEEVLPARFGGSVGDYQLVESQDDRGLPRYTLVVSPGLDPIDEPALVAGFLAELARLRPPYPFMVDQWAQGGTLHVRRAFPAPTSRGKVPPVLTLGGGIGRT
jgi:hypothetical protein